MTDDYAEVHGQGILTPRPTRGPIPRRHVAPFDPAGSRIAAPLFDMTPFVERVQRLQERRRPVERGDRVILRNLVAYVQDIHRDAGTVSLASTREPFDSPIVLDRCHVSRLTLQQKAPTEPCVGDTISGKQVRETAWRRGTTLRNASGAGMGDLLVLTGTGRWVNVTVDDCAEPPLFGFDDFEDRDRFEVVAAPGKVDPADEDDFDL